MNKFFQSRVRSNEKIYVILMLKHYCFIYNDVASTKAQNFLSLSDVLIAIKKNIDFNDTNNSL